MKGMQKATKGVISIRRAIQPVEATKTKQMTAKRICKVPVNKKTATKGQRNANAIDSSMAAQMNGL